MPTRPLQLNGTLRSCTFPAALVPLALAAALGCGDDRLPTRPAVARGAGPLALTVSPAALDFTSPSAAPQTITAAVQYTGVIAASGSTCATASPLSVPAAKPEGSSVYLATFEVTPVAVGACTITITDKKGVAVLVPVNVGAGGEMYFAAHQDDDLLFMNPDIGDAIAAGRYVTTVYVTAGSCSGDTEYYLTREAGVRAAYARYAGVADEWIVTGHPVHEVRLAAEPRVSLVFFRLTASRSEAGDVCDLSTTNLRGLWSAGAASPALAVTSLDGANSYTRDQLIAALAELIRRWHPVRIGTLDASGLFGTGADPSGLQIAYPSLGGACYYYDHSDHYHSALFARAAAATYQDVHAMVGYRGYNQANEAENVAGGAFALKQAGFEAYGEHDFFVPDDPPFGGLYEPWLSRQYRVETSPAPEQPLCPAP